MVTVYDQDKAGNMIVVYDSRWRFPELLGYEKDTKEYRALQERWETATGERISNNGDAGTRRNPSSRHSPSPA